MIKQTFETTDFEQGSLDASGGNASGSNFVRTKGYFHVNKGDVFMNTSSIVTSQVFVYNENKEYSSYIGWIGLTPYTIPDDGFIRLKYKNVGSGAAIDNVSIIASSAVIQRNTAAQTSNLNSKILNANNSIYKKWEDSHINFFDSTKCITGAIKTNGSFDSSYTSWMTTDYLLIDPTKHYEFYNFALKTKRTSNITVNIYDSRKNRLNTVSVRDAVPDYQTVFNNFADYTFPADALYIRFSLQKTYSKALMFVVSSYVPLIYSAYNQKNYYNSNFTRGTAVVSYGKQGYNTNDKYNRLPIYPHSSVVSFVAALNEGFDGIWFAVLYTYDGEPVLCHNDNIYGLAVNSDGTALSNPYNISEHTFSEISALDFGLPYGAIYEGTKILTLEEGIRFAKHYGVKIGIEIESGESEARYTDIANLVKSYGMDKNVSIFSYNASNLEIVSEMLPYATLYLYGGSTSAQAITAATSVSQLITQTNEVYLLFTPFTVDLTQEAITSIKALGVKIGYTNPNSEPDTIVDFFEQAKNNYISMCISRVIPAWKALRDNVEII